MGWDELLSVRRSLDKLGTEPTKQSKKDNVGGDDDDSVIKKKNSSIGKSSSSRVTKKLADANTRERIESSAKDRPASPGDAKRRV